MKKLNKYDEYKLEMLMESFKKDESILVLSDKLEKLLSNIVSPIKDELFKVINLNDYKFKITLLDINDKVDVKGNKILDSISFVSSNKVLDTAFKYLNINLEKDEELNSNDNLRLRSYLFSEDRFSIKSKSETSLGRIINKLFPGKFDPNRDIEPFVNSYKSLRDISKFELVKGDDIVYWYNEVNYIHDGGPLNSSCMRYNHTSDYIRFYSINTDNVQLLILKDKDDDTKIRGRAIIWKLDFPKNRIFMDRIYYTKDYMVDLFKEYAKDNGWLYKYNQNMDEDEDIIDSLTGNPIDEDDEDSDHLLVVDLKDPGVGYYPYMDTMKYFDRSSLSNDYGQVDDYIELTHTDGGAEGDETGEWSDHYNGYIDVESGEYNWCERGGGYRHIDDCFYSEYYDESIADDYASNNGTYCDYSDDGDDWREYSDVVELSNGETATQDYADDNCYYSEYSNEWCLNANWSEEHQTYIEENSSIEVYTDAEQSNTDYRSDDDNTYFKWEHDGEYYDNNVEIEELEEYNGLKEEEEEEEEEEEQVVKIKKTNKNKHKKNDDEIK